VPVVQRGFHGREYARLRGDLRTYDDRFDDYWAFLEPRLEEAWRLLADDGTLYLHLDYREVHYAKVMCDALFGRERFLNELIWAYDYGAKTRRRWPTKHETILVYVKNPAAYFFDSDAVDREPYMAPGLVTPEKAARGKLPTDVWWHTIVPTTGREKTGYPTQKPEGVLRRMVQASSRPGDRVLDMFAGSGTLGAVAAPLGRHSVLIDDNADAVAVMRQRLASSGLVPWCRRAVVPSCGRAVVPSCGVEGRHAGGGGVWTGCRRQTPRDGTASGCRIGTIGRRGRPAKLGLPNDVCVRPRDPAGRARPYERRSPRRQRAHRAGVR